MPVPKNVKPAKFPSPVVLYDNDNFSIAWGLYEGHEKRLAMRWNEGPGKAGYPNRGKYPVWFYLPKEISVSVVKGLLGDASANQKAVLKALDELFVTPSGKTSL